MRSGRLLAFATAVTAVVLGASQAHAGSDVEVVLRPGYGSAGDKSPVLYHQPPTGNPPTAVGSIWDGTATPYRAGFVFDGAVGYRPLSFISFGVTGGWRKSAVSSSAISFPISDASRTGWQVGVYAKGYVPLIGAWTRIDPWASIGATYVYDKQTYRQTLPLPMTVSLTHQGVGIPLSFGVDYRVLSILAIGPFFQYEIVTAMGGCMDNPVDHRQCNDADSSIRMTAVKNYNVWSLGLSLRLTM